MTRWRSLNFTPLSISPRGPSRLVSKNIAGDRGLDSAVETWLWSRASFGSAYFDVGWTSPGKS